MPDIETQQTHAENASITAPTPKKPMPPGPTRNSPKGRLKGMITIGVIALVLVIGCVFLYRFLNSESEVNAEIYSQTAYIGNISSSVQGNGMARAKETAAITLTQGGLVEDVYITQGEIVTAGQPLYVISSEAAEEAVTLAQEKVNTLNEDLADLNEEFNNLTVVAPFAGKLIEVSDFTIDETISSGESVATIVNDKKLKLPLYFSYAYEDMIYVGQNVTVSIPSVMGTFAATVEKINKVSFVTPEGSIHFEAVIVFDNPGALTAEMDASAIIYLADGSEIYPYENGKTQFYETRKIETKTGGPLIWQDLLAHANVTAGQPLLTMSSSSIDSKLREKQKELEDAMSKLDEAIKGLDDFSAVAPIDGRITSCTLAIGGEVKSGDTVIVISNTTDMVVEITVDDRNIGFVSLGLEVELSDWNGNTFIGTVTSIDTGNAESGNGMTQFPVTLSVENYSGTLIESTWLDYSFVASQSEDCIIVPMQSVYYVSDEEGETHSVVFVEAPERPENAIDLNVEKPEPGQMPQYPTEDAGYYAVPVVTGLSDITSVEIREGLQGEETVFVRYYTEQASNW